MGSVRNILYENRKLLIVLWIIYTLEYMVFLTIVISSVTGGEQLRELELQKQQLVLDNQVLKNEISFKASLLYIKPQALRLGFVPIKTINRL
jgi:cell division protein FtsB